MREEQILEPQILEQQRLRERQQMQQQQVSGVVLDLPPLSSSHQPLPTPSYNISIPLRPPLPTHQSGFESSSDSYYGGVNGCAPILVAPAGGPDVLASGGSYSCTPEPGLEYPYQPHGTLHLSGQPYLPPGFHSHPYSYQSSVPVGPSGSGAYHYQSIPSINRQPSMSGMSSHGRQNSLMEQQQQHHYNTTSALHDMQHRQHPIIQPDMYMPYSLQTTHTVNSNVASNTDPLMPHPPLQPPSLQPPPPPSQVDHTSSLPQARQQFPSFSDVPQSELLSKAFMVFLRAMGTVFRDPSFSPLFESLDVKSPTEVSAPPPKPPRSRAASRMEMGPGRLSPPLDSSQDDRVSEVGIKPFAPELFSQDMTQDMTEDVSDNIDEEMER